MSQDIKGSIDYSLTKQHYDADDYVAIPFTVAQDYYIVGMAAYFSDPTVFNANYGWTTFAHGQSAMPTWLATLIAFGIIPPFTWPIEVPAFEAKDILFRSDQDCYVRFGGSLRVQHFIPANTFVRFHRRCFIIFAQRVTADGTLNVWVEG